MRLTPIVGAVPDSDALVPASIRALPNRDRAASFGPGRCPDRDQTAVGRCTGEGADRDPVVVVRDRRLSNRDGELTRARLVAEGDTALSGGRSTDHDRVVGGVRVVAGRDRVSPGLRARADRDPVLCARARPGAELLGVRARARDRQGARSGRPDRDRVRSDRDRRAHRERSGRCIVEEAPGSSGSRS